MLKPVIMDHPLIQHKLTIMRDKNTGTKEFRELVGEIGMLMCYEATRDLPLKEVEIETPVAVAKTKVISGRKLAFVPILRAGLGMVDGVMRMVPAAKIGHIGMYRDPETHMPVEYYCKLPSDIGERDVIVLDPMLATGGSAIDAISQIKNKGAKSVRFMKVLPLCRKLILTYRFISARWTKSSMSISTSFPAWATPATGFSVRNSFESRSPFLGNGLFFCAY